MQYRLDLHLPMLHTTRWHTLAKKKDRPRALTRSYRQPVIRPCELFPLAG